MEGIAQETLLEETDRGLMTYFYGSQTLEKKVVSLKPTVENVRGTLYGVAVCQVKAPLTPGELAELKDYCGAKALNSGPGPLPTATCMSTSGRARDFLLRQSRS